MADTAKKAPSLDIVFGAPMKRPGGMSDMEDHEEARDMLKDALGWDDEKVDALHEYIMSCMGSAGAHEDEDEEEAPESGKGY